MRLIHILAPGLLALIVSLSGGCRDEDGRAGEPSEEDDNPVPVPDTSEVVLRFGVVIRNQPRLTVAGSKPLIDYLSEATPYRVELRMGRSSEDVELDVGMQDLLTFLEERFVEIAPLGVLSYCLADERFSAVALVQSVNDEGEPQERMVFVTRTSSEVRTLEDLRGRRLALGPSHSMLSHVLAVHELQNAGVSPETSNLESDDAVVDAVRNGSVDAGAVAEHVVADIGDDTLRVFHESRPIPSRPLVVRADLPEPVQESLRAALLELDKKAMSGSDRLFRNGFAPAVEADYAPVRRILNEQGARCTGSCHEPVGFGDSE